jgi:uncharacterized Zn-finger protein
LKSPKITILCPNPKCGKSTPELIVKLELAKEIVCPFCGNRIDLTTKHWQVALREAFDEGSEIKPKST